MSANETITFEQFKDYSISSGKVCTGVSLSMAFLGSTPFVVAPIHGAFFSFFTVSWWLIVDHGVTTLFPDFNPTDPNHPIAYNVALTLLPIALSIITSSHMTKKAALLLNREVTYSNLIKLSSVDSIAFIIWAHFYEPKESM